MKSEGSLLRRLDDVRPGGGTSIARPQPVSKVPAQAPTRAPALVPPSQKNVVTYKVHGAPSNGGIAKWGKWISFVLAVVIPTVIGGIYYAFFAAPQYISEFRFSVRPNLGASSGSSSADTMLVMSNSYIVSDYVGSRDAVLELDKAVGLRDLYSSNVGDYFSKLDTNASTEALISYWNSRIHTSYDITTGINIIEISAFTPEDAQKIANALKILCERLVNQISDESRKSQMEFARVELDRSEARLKDVRLKETELRTAQKSIDARKEADGRLELNLKLRSELASLQAQYDSLKQYMDPKSPRLSVMKNQISATQDQVVQLQNQVGNGINGSQVDGDLINAQVITRYDQIQTDVEIASKLYASSLTNYESARAQASHNQIYLATYVQPGLAQIATYPRVFFDTFLIFLSACGIWVVLTLIYYSIRDHV
jgi:capsular polysaccharide transport system permease protein